MNNFFGRILIFILLVYNFTLNVREMFLKMYLEVINNVHRQATRDCILCQSAVWWVQPKKAHFVLRVICRLKKKKLLFILYAITFLEWKSPKTISKAIHNLLLGQLILVTSLTMQLAHNCWNQLNELDTDTPGVLGSRDHSHCWDSFSLCKVMVNCRGDGSYSFGVSKHSTCFV